MKVLFIEARKKTQEKINISNIEDKFSKKIHLLYTIQYKDLAEKIKERLEKKKFKIVGFEQVLGCSEIKPKADLLLIGSGEFHPLQLAFSTEKEIYLYNNGNIEKIGKDRIKKAKKRIKAKVKKFFSSNKIGIIISNKPGQNKMSQAVKIKKTLSKRFNDKNFYLLITNNISIGDLENYKIDLFINTACPGLEFDSSKIINYKNLKDYIKK